ncbi:MAG: PAS domain-containing protein [Caldilineaceae bacterium]|nr:PAS domain-containing protein [Caldilineaceae bacterium]
MSEAEPQTSGEFETSKEPPVQPRFPVVGIGASAGGLRALRQFFEQSPNDSGMAFVIVTHLAPDHESHLAELLQSATTMPIQQVQETVPLEPNHVYVIPPNRNLSSIDTQLHLEQLEEDRRARAPIDHFFRTLSATHGPKAICIVLSGTGADGAIGLERVKEMGGLTLAQDPEDAEYDSMPQNAIATGQVDLVLPVREMPHKIIEYLRHSTLLPDVEESEVLAPGLQDTVQKILTQVRIHTGHDFSRYKAATVMRRIQHRMQILGLTDFDDYLTILRSQQGEAYALFNDFLITVTNFFRDQSAFETLEREVIPKLFVGKGNHDQVRVWIVGCATGEEAYSIAMLLLEHADTIDDPPSIQLFASDLSESALRRARDGFYPETIAADVSGTRLQRFFVKEQGGYRIRKDVRELVLFAPHNLLKDPPFSRIDLISCRNLLIYLNRDVQHEIFELFHYALRPHRYLFLGSSEVLDNSELFLPISRAHSIYQQQDIARQERHLPMLPLSLPVYRSVPSSFLPSVPRENTASYGALHNQLLERYAPPSLLVDSSYNIIHFSPGISRFLYQPPGTPTNSVLERVREEFRPEFSTLLFRAFERKEPGISRPIRVQMDGKARWVTVGIWPASEDDKRDVVLILFYERDELGIPENTEAPAQEETGDSTIMMLEEDLAAMRQRLQTMAEEFETSQEEMKASNEELQSINEELRSTAEELETSKEELQSINEELITVNQENKNKVEELSQLTSDLQNLLAATDIATIFLDRDLRITRFTPRVGELFNVLMSDRGRPLAHITHKLGYGKLIEDASTVLRTLVPIEREVSSDQNRGYLMRLLPYRTIEDRISGVVITFVDITERIQHEQELQKLMAGLDQRVTERTAQVRTLASKLLAAEQQVQERMAQVLHDDLQQVLYGARMHIKVITDEVGKEQMASLPELLSDLDGIIVQAIDLTRLVISDLAPRVLDKSDLAEMLTALAMRMKEMHGLIVNLEVGKDQPITDDSVQMVIQQVVREILFNVVKHAGVDRAQMKVVQNDGELWIEVEDKGRGFDTRILSSGILPSGSEGSKVGFGLTKVRERLNWLGADLRFESKPEQGTRVTVVLPMTETNSNSDDSKG